MRMVVQWLYSTSPKLQRKFCLKLLSIMIFSTLYNQNQKKLTLFRLHLAPAPSSNRPIRAIFRNTIKMLTMPYSYYIYCLKKRNTNYIKRTQWNRQIMTTSIFYFFRLWKYSCCCLGQTHKSRITYFCSPM